MSIKPWFIDPWLLTKAPCKTPLMHTQNTIVIRLSRPVEDFFKNQAKITHNSKNTMEHYKMHVATEIQRKFNKGALVRIVRTDFPKFGTKTIYFNFLIFYSLRKLAFTFPVEDRRIRILNAATEILS